MHVLEEFMIVIEQFLKIGQPDEFRRRQQVPFLESEPERGNNRVDDENEQANQAGRQEEYDPFPFLPSL